MLRVADALWPAWIVLGLVIPGLIGGLVKENWLGVWTGVIWGGLVRMFLVHHVTFGVNSACHLWGSQPYQNADQSRNNVVVGILALGEGWHNTHHAFPTSARHGLRWWQIDLSYYVICAMSWVGLAWSVRVPSAEFQQRSIPATRRDRSLWPHHSTVRMGGASSVIPFAVTAAVRLTWPVPSARGSVTRGTNCAMYRSRPRYRFPFDCYPNESVLR